MNVDLFITAGPNRGAYVPILPGRHSVGASDEADIVLEGTPTAGLIVFEVGAGRVRVTPAGGAVARVDGRVLGRGGATLQTGMGIEFGETELRVFWDTEGVVGEQSRSGSRYGWGVRLLGVLAVLGGTGIFLAEIWDKDLRKTARPGENPNPAVAQPVGQAVPKVAGDVSKPSRLMEPVSGSMLEGVEARVKSVLRGTGLSGKLESGRLVVTGSVLTAKDEKRLEGMIAEVRPYIEVDLSGVRGLGGGNAAPPPNQVVATAHIVAINIADVGPGKSYFETQDGGRYYEGAIFGDGYIVSEIHPTLVSMEKGGRKLEYALTGR